MSKPNYRVNLTFDPQRKVFQAQAPELEHCSAEGATRGEAIGNLEQEIDAQLANMLSHGSTPPKSVDEEEFTGEFTVKVSRTLHRDLAWQARNEGLELQNVVGELLAAALEGRRGTHRGPRSGNRAPQEHHGGNDNIGNRHDGGGARRQGFGGRGTQVLDDRATFIEYVRGLEQGGGQHQRGGHSGGGHGGGHSNNNNNNNGRRRGNRGGRGGQGGGGGFRHDGQQQRPQPRNEGYSAAPAQPSAPPPNATNGSGGGGDDGGGNI